MFRSRWIWLVLAAILGIAAIYVSSNPEMASRYAQAQRDAALSADTKQTVMLLIALAVGGYLAWFFLIRKE
ncbi:hypothetical protein ACETRX_09405 [Labrys portucalensis]|uniref:Uncharacterized protein n=1 Tax=Labrys neptuniae TaxID=376174 RepID=A0ABV6ZCA1_9HYPH|nr:hypothetical protein [Labrys neptuniae]MDT3376135.1 hypothetical protein [Labrys neptuniae]